MLVAAFQLELTLISEKAVLAERQPFDWFGLFAPFPPSRGQGMLAVITCKVSVSQSFALQNRNHFWTNSFITWQENPYAGFGSQREAIIISSNSVLGLCSVIIIAIINKTSKDPDLLFPPSFLSSLFTSGNQIDGYSVPFLFQGCTQLPQHM